jgi:hypothetical protein
MGPVGPVGAPGLDAVRTTLTARVGVAALRRGRAGSLRVRVTNTGRGAAPDVELLAVLPDGVRRSSGAARGPVRLRLGTIPSGATRTATIAVRTARTARRGRAAVSTVVASQTAPTAVGTSRIRIR